MSHTFAYTIHIFTPGALPITVGYDGAVANFGAFVNDIAEANGLTVGGAELEDRSGNVVAKLN